MCQPDYSNCPAHFCPFPREPNFSRTSGLTDRNSYVCVCVRARGGGGGGSYKAREGGEGM